jgi:hypothetical protein
VKILAKDNKYGFYKIPIADIKKKTQSAPFYVRPDVYVYEVNPNDIPKDVIIYSIEKFIHPEFNCDELQTAITCGYPDLNTHDKKVTLSATPSCNFEKVLDYCHPSYYQDMNTYDTINYPISMPYEAKGYSGSPVYVIYRGQICFGGIFCVELAPNKVGFVVKPKYVLSQLK